MRLDEETYLSHYGILRKSGRYKPVGFGGQSQSTESIVSRHREAAPEGRLV